MLSSGVKRLIFDGKKLVAAPTLTIDGVVTVTDGTSITSKVFPGISTTKANTVLVMHAITNSSAINSITDTAGLTWTQRANSIVTATSTEEWTAKSSGILTNNIITVTFNTTSAFFSANAFAVAGSNFASPFDPNGVIPANQTAPHFNVTLTTTNAKTMLIAGYRMNSTTTPTAGPGWTTIGGADFLLSEYMVVSSAQPSTLATLTVGDTDEFAGLGDAITA